MKKILVSYEDIKKINSFSAEYHLGINYLSTFILSDFCTSISIKNKSEAKLVLDTSAGNNGLLQLVSYSIINNKSKSHNKLLPAGCIAISRLRTYLHQIICFSERLAYLCGVDSVIVSSEFVVLKPININPYELTLILLSKNVQQYLADCTAGGHHPRVAKDLILRAPVEQKDLDYASKNWQKFADSSEIYLTAQKQVQDIFNHMD